jgi:hypothetical protein
MLEKDSGIGTLYRTEQENKSIGETPSKPTAVAVAKVNFLRRGYVGAPDNSAMLGSDWIGSMGRTQSSAGKFTGAPGAAKRSCCE